MQDQVNRLKEAGVAAECLYSGMDYKSVKNVLQQAVDGAYKLLYISPERLQTWLFKDYLYHIDISMVAVDEAHCVSQWGHDFRPDYLKIHDIRALFPDVPVLAVTATATGDVLEDIGTQLKLKNPAIFRQSFARTNIHFAIRYSEAKPNDVLQALHPGCNIVYCRSRKQTENTGDWLLQNGIPASVYHAGKEKADRMAAQKSWMADKTRVMVATTAFGMGIDKPDVRAVIHMDAPEHLEAWYQEAGRAGRDGKPSKTVTLYNHSDIERLEESTDLHYPPERYLRQVYQSVAEYLQIPIGNEPDQYFDFDLSDFCRKFRLDLTPAIYALKLLEREGLWTLSESVHFPSTVQFTCERDAVGHLEQHHPTLHWLAVNLLRMFNGIFYYPVNVRESAVAWQLKITADDLKRNLIQLHKMGVIKYNPTREGPQMFFHHLRVDSRHLTLNMKRIKTLRDRHQYRVRHMIAFLQNNEVCREQNALAYFGETTAPCGHCDICDRAAAKKLTEIEIRQLIIQQLTANNRSLTELVESTGAINSETTLYIVRAMLDEEQIMKNGTQISLRTL
jgi:ATP-dependent DNA helicase RecQ